MDATEQHSAHAIPPGVAVLLTDVAYEVRRLEQLCGHDLRLTPALVFWALHRAEKIRCAHHIPSEPECVHAALRELVPVGSH